MIRAYPDENDGEGRVAIRALGRGNHNNATRGRCVLSADNVTHFCGLEGEGYMSDSLSVCSGRGVPTTTHRLLLQSTQILHSQICALSEFKCEFLLIS